MYSELDSLDKKESMKVEVKVILYKSFLTDYISHQIKRRLPFGLAAL